MPNTQRPPFDPLAPQPPRAAIGRPSSPHPGSNQTNNVSSGSQQHVMKVQNMKPSIDMKTPISASFKHLQYNSKRMQMEAERNADIERENKILLGKMYTIMNAEPAYKSDLTSSSVQSLNMTVRKQEYDRIARENQAIMQRILQREPHFDRRALDEDWKVTQRYLHNISEYPFILGNLPPATRKKTLRPLGQGSTDELVSHIFRPQKGEVDSNVNKRPNRVKNHFFRRSLKDTRRLASATNALVRDS